MACFAYGPSVTGSLLPSTPHTGRLMNAGKHILKSVPIDLERACQARNDAYIDL